MRRLAISILLTWSSSLFAQKVLSSSSNQWVQDTTLRIVRTVKLPAMPKQVVAEQSHDWVDFQAEWSFERNLPKPAAYAYQTQTSELARQPIMSELAKCPAHGGAISMKAVFEIDQLGRAHVIQVLSKPSNYCLEEAVRRALNRTKFPPPSKKVLDELGTPRVHAEAELGIR